MPSMSVLRGPRPRLPLAKVVGGKQPSRKVKYWESITRVDLPHPDDLFILLSAELEGDAYSCLIPGIPGEANEAGLWRRALQSLPKNKKNPEEGKDPPGVIAGPGCSVLILDHDSGKYPKGTGESTPPEELAKALAWHYCRVAGLDVPVSGVVQFSGSHKTEKGCRAKLFFLLESPHKWKLITDYCKARLGTDSSVSSPAQIVYTAAPLYEGGAVDPMGGAPRTYFVEGKRPRWPDIPVEDTDVDAWRRLYRTCQAILEIPVGEPRHPVINSEAWQVGRYVIADRLPEDVAADWIRQACDDSEAVGPGRTDMDEILRALRDGAKAPAAPREVMASLDVTKDGAIRPVLGNAVALLDGVKTVLNDFGDLEITRAPQWAREGEKYPTVLDDGQILRATVWLHKEHRVAFKPREVLDAFKFKGALNPVDRLKNYLDRVAELPPGRVSLDNIAATGWGADNSDAHRLGVTKFFIQAVRRAYEPGCKAELVLILHGPPGIGKTRSIRALFTRAGDCYFTSSHIPIGNQQLYAPIIRGLWGAELAEQRSVSQWHQDLFKNFLSLQSIKHKVPYDRTASTFYLRVNYVWSTESDTPLTDSNYRRMVLLKVRNWQDLSTDDIDAFWGDAVRAYRAGRPAWIDTEEAEVLRDIREAALERDPLHEAVDELLHVTDIQDSEQPQVWVLNRLASNPRFGVRVSDPSAKDRVGKIMGRLGWRRRVVRDGAGTRRTWVPPRGWTFTDAPPMGEVLEFPKY